MDLRKCRNRHRDDGRERFVDFSVISLRRVCAHAQGLELLDVPARAEGLFTRAFDEQRPQLRLAGKRRNQCGKPRPVVFAQSVKPLRRVQDQRGDTVIRKRKIKHGGLLSRPVAYREMFDCWRKSTCSTLSSVKGKGLPENSTSRFSRTAVAASDFRL